MAENLKNHNYVFGEGGTGIRVLLATSHWLNTKAMAESSHTAAENWHLVYETMDAGNEEIGEVLRLQALQEKIGTFGDPGCSFSFVKLAESTAKMAGKETEQDAKNREQGIRLRDVLDEWFQNELLLTEEQLNKDISGGYYRDQTIGSIVLPLGLASALETEEDQKYGFQAVIEDVLNSNGNYQVRLAFVANGFGGEGVTNICDYPGIIKELCITRMMDALDMNWENAKLCVEKTLKIAVVMTGAAFRFPSTKNLNQNIAGLVGGTLRSYPDISAEAVNLFYLLESDNCPVQASQASEYGRQHKKAHAIELVAVAMLEDFFHRSTEQVSKKQCPVIPVYSMPGHGFTNWDNLGLPKSYREKLSARLRFDTALLYWMKPQLLVSSEERSAGKLYQSEILHQMYHEKTDKKLEGAIDDGKKWDLDDDILEPLRALCEREQMFLKFLLEISQTGKNWETGMPAAAGCGSSLFPVERLENLLQEENSENSIWQYGGMTGFCLDDMTKCPVNPVTQKAEDNIYMNRLTLDKLRKRVYKEKKIRESLNGMLSAVYEISSKRKEK